MAIASDGEENLAVCNRAHRSSHPTTGELQSVEISDGPNRVNSTLSNIRSGYAQILAVNSENVRQGRRRRGLPSNFCGDDPSLNRHGLDRR